MGKWDMCLYFVAMVWVVLGESEWAAWARVWVGEVVVMYVCVVNFDYLCLWQVQVSVNCARRIPAHLRCTQCSILLSVTDIANPDLFACGSRTWISLDIARFYEEHCKPAMRTRW